MILDAPATLERYARSGWWGSRTIDDLFRDCVAQCGSQLALVDAPNRAAFAFGAPKQLTFDEVEKAVSQVAAALLDAGARKDSVVLVQLPNVVEIVIAFLACIRIGAILSPIMLAYGERDLRRIIRHVRPDCLITVTAFKLDRPAALAARICAELPDVHTAILAYGARADGEGAQILDIERMGSDLRSLESYLQTLSVQANEIVTMHWTSGTTGDPKCVPRTHNHWHATGGCCVDAGGLQPGERILAPMQMVHTAGMSGLVMPWLETHGRLVLHQPFDMGVFLDQIESHKINHTVAAPAMLNALLRDNTLDDRDVASIRSILCGSAPLDPWMIEGFRQRYGIEIINAFGSTEGMTMMSGPGITDDPYRRARYFPRFCGTAARPGSRWPIRIADVVETKIVDLESGEEILQPRAPGELLFRSPALFPGYWTDERQLDRRDFDAAGFFRSGEIFEIAGDGPDEDFYHYIDRLKDVINRGGVKIPVGELEAAIQQHPKILEAAAIGYPDIRIGERICAVVTLTPGAVLTLEELITELAAASVPKYMLPERLEIVSALPRNAVGKILKRQLTEELLRKHRA